MEDRAKHTQGEVWRSAGVKDGISEGGPGVTVLSYADLESSLQIARLWAFANAILSQ